MANSIAEYQKVYDEAIRSYELVIEKVKRQIIGMESVEIDLNETNYDDISVRQTAKINNYRTGISNKREGHVTVNKL